MKVVSVSVVYIFCLMGTSAAQENDALPTTMPPLIGMAVVHDAGLANQVGEWRIRLTLPKISWHIKGQDKPIKAWPKLETGLEKQTIMLRMDGPSALLPSYVVDLKGQPLNREQILARLRHETPVWVSVDGKKPDPYYLQLTYPEALIVILGDREKAPRPDLLPAKKITASKN